MLLGAVGQVVMLGTHRIQACVRVGHFNDRPHVLLCSENKL